MPSLYGPAEACFERWKSAWAGGGWSGSSCHGLGGPNRPARAFGAGSEPRLLRLLRAINGYAQSVKRVKAWIPRRVPLGGVERGNRSIVWPLEGAEVMDVSGPRHELPF